MNPVPISDHSAQGLALFRWQDAGRTTGDYQEAGEPWAFNGHFLFSGFVAVDGCEPEDAERCPVPSWGDPIHQLRGGEHGQEMEIFTYRTQLGMSLDFSGKEGRPSDL